MNSLPRPLPPISDEVAATFWRRVQKTETCWLWTGPKRSAMGYGFLRVPVETPYGTAHIFVGAHRLAYTLTRGPIPSGLILLHSCDTPPCVNPAHLRPGTPKENGEDASRRDRMSRYWAKLNVATAAEIRRLYHEARSTVGSLARRYGLSKPGVIAVVTGTSWRLAPGPIGPIRKTVGPMVFGAKLDEKRVAEIRGRFAAGETIYDLARAFSVAPQTVSKIIRNTYWKHVAPMPAKSVRPGHRKLTREQVTKIRQRHARGVSQRRLAREYRVSPAAICMLVNGKTHPP